MARLSRKQYEMVGIAFGEALAEVKKLNSPDPYETFLVTVKKVSEHFVADNHNFDPNLFLESIHEESESVLSQRLQVDL